jgi:hypothetical protein
MDTCCFCASGYACAGNMRGSQDSSHVVAMTTLTMQNAIPNGIGSANAAGVGMRSCAEPGGGQNVCSEPQRPLACHDICLFCHGDSQIDLCTHFCLKSCFWHANSAQ